MPIQIYWKFYNKKNENFHYDIFHSSAQNIYCRYALEPPRWGGSNAYHNLCFWAEIRKIMYNPVNPSFTIQKWGLRGPKLYRHVFVIRSAWHRAVWSESSIGALWIAKDTNFLHADNEDSDQTARFILTDLPAHENVSDPLKCTAQT